MKRLLTRALMIAARHDGTAVLEYALLVSLISLASLSTIKLVEGRLQGSYSSVEGVLSTPGQIESPGGGSGGGGDGGGDESGDGKGGKK